MAVRAYKASEQNQLANKTLRWMETQTYPDTCGPQGQFPYKYSNGRPCFTKNGYRFVSGVDNYGQWTTPFRRIVKVRPEEEWTMRDVIVSWTNDWLINQMQLHTASLADLQDLVRHVPEIEKQP